MTKEEAKPLPRRTPATLTVKFRGGAECWWEISYGRKTVRVSGVIYLHDAMRRLFED